MTATIPVEQRIFLYVPANDVWCIEAIRALREHNEFWSVNQLGRMGLLLLLAHLGCSRASREFEHTLRSKPIDARVLKEFEQPKRTD